jgi:hypothetical protein
MRLGHLVTLAVGALLMASCGLERGGEVAQLAAVGSGGGGDGLSGWLDAVEPHDGASSGQPTIEVIYPRLPAGHGLRVLVDGIDVSNQLEGRRLVAAEDGEVFPSPGRLRYDPAAWSNPVAGFGPGGHEAVVQLVELAGATGAGNVLDEHRWRFDVPPPPSGPADATPPAAPSVVAHDPQPA